MAEFWNNQRIDKLYRGNYNKFDKVKYHCGHRVEGVWIVGGIQRKKKSDDFVEN